jgi:hypothetical protein
MTHVRDIDVLYTMKGIRFIVPLHLEKEMSLIVKDVRVEMGRMVIETVKKSQDLETPMK